MGNIFERLNKKDLFKFAFILVGAIFILSWGSGTSSAANSTIYVSTHGNDSWNGLYAVHTNGTNGPKATIKNGIISSKTNGKLYVSNGVYSEYNLQITRNITIIGQSQTSTIIDAGKLGQIFNNTASTTLQTLTLRNGYYLSGGAISNWGNLTLLNCTLANNTASANGGAIESRNSGFSIGGSDPSNVQLIVINSTFINNAASQSKGEGGAIIFEYGILNINNSTFISNSATDSGAVLGSNANIKLVNTKFINNTAVNDGGAIRILLSTADINGCTFNGNTATNGVGGAVCGILATNITIHYNWLYGDNANTGAEIYSDNGNMNATLNWWGSNSDRGAWIYNALYDPWIIVKANATPNTVVNYGTSTINTNLWYDSNDKYIYGSDYNLPYIPAQFYRNSVKTTEFTIHNGSANTILNFAALTSGVARITDMVGEEQVTVSILLKDTIPTVTVNKKGGLYNTSQLINFVLSEPATIYYTTDGSTPTFNSSRYYAPFKISTNTVLKFFAIDLSGNPSAIYTEKYVIDTQSPTIVKIDPLNNAKKVSKTKPITLTFNEAVKITSNQIVLKNSSGKVISTTKVLNGKLLTINHSALANGTYTLTIPMGSVTDTAGNKIKSYSFKFTVG